LDYRAGYTLIENRRKNILSTDYTGSAVLELCLMCLLLIYLIIFRPLAE